MPSKIVLLEDAPDRIAAMLPRISQRLPRYTVIAFDNAPDLIDWLGNHLDDSGWTHRRVVPYNDLDWIRTAWLPEVEDALTRQ